MQIGAKTDIGKVREQNEDTFGYRDNLFIVADGMGGHQAGEVASAIAVESILSAEIATTEAEIPSSLVAAVNKANTAIIAETIKHPEISGMGTTLAIVLLLPQKAVVAHLGDSRVYHFAQGILTQLTDDHSVVAELVRSGGLSEDEAKNHPQRNLLTRPLGGNNGIDLDINIVPVSTGDKFLLCSDGLTGMVTDDSLKEYLSQNEAPQKIADLLVEAANLNGGVDNITVIVLEV